MFSSGRSRLAPSTANALLGKRDNSLGDLDQFLKEEVEAAQMMFDAFRAAARDEAGDGDEELWLTKGRRGDSLGEWGHDESSDSDSDTESEEAIRMVSSSNGDDSDRDAVTLEAQTAWERAVAIRDAKKKRKQARSRGKDDGRSRDQRQERR